MRSKTSVNSKADKDSLAGEEYVTPTQLFTLFSLLSLVERFLHIGWRRRASEACA